MRNADQASLIGGLRTARRHVRLFRAATIHYPDSLATHDGSESAAIQLSLLGYVDCIFTRFLINAFVNLSTKLRNVTDFYQKSTATIRLLFSRMELKMSAKLSMASSWSDVWTRTCPKLTITSAGGPPCII